MKTYLRPGTFTEETILQVQPASAPSAPPGAFLSANHRGPTTFTRVESFSAYTKLFGGFKGDDLLPYAVFSYFNNGGRVAYVCRVLSSGAVAATRTLNDRDAVTPLPTLAVTAHNQGVWGNSVYIDVTDGTATGLFNILVHDGDTTNTTIVERWMDLSMDPESSRYVEKVINGVSTYIVVDDQDSTTASPNDLPAVTAGQVLAGGADGTSPTTQEKSDALRLLDDVSEAILINLPGEASAAVVGDMISYAEAREDVFAIVDTDRDVVPADAVTYIDSINPSSSYGAAYYPWVWVSDPASSARNAQKLVPPGGAVMGQYVRTDALRGVFKTPAGIGNRLAGVVRTERKLTNADYDLLNQANVNALKTVSGGGVLLYGGRTLRNTLEADRYISARRTLIYLKRALVDLTQFAPFENNDEALWAQIRATTSSFLSGFWQTGGLRGSSAEQAFFVKCDEENNPPETVSQGYTYIDVGVALQFPAEFIVFRLGQFQGSTTVSEL